MRRWVLSYVGVCLLAAGGSPTADAQGKTARSEPSYEIKPSTRQQVQEARRWTASLEKKAKQIAPKLQRFETPYFVLYSTFGKQADNKQYRDRADLMFRKLCEQFKADPRRVWVDKCPIFAFTDAKQYVAFLTSIGIDESAASKTGGLMVSRSDGMVCIILNASADESAFFNTMVHEGTHAFMVRFLTARPLPSWVNEGIAEHMCARVVENSRTNDLWQRATRQVLDGEKKPESIFGGVALDTFDYGMAHALVRHMIEKDGTAFSRFVRLLKQGESEEAALKAAYRTNRAGLLKDWRAGAEKALEAAEKAAEKTAEKTTKKAEK